MKKLTTFFFLVVFLPVTSFAHVSEDSPLNQEVLAMGTAFFNAYNTCDLDTQYKHIAADIEFFHDKGKFTNDKQGLLTGIKNNICGKVTRRLISGSFKVHAIADYGDVALGYHTFFNKLEPEATQKPGRFSTSSNVQ